MKMSDYETRPKEMWKITVRYVFLSQNNRKKYNFKALKWNKDMITNTDI